MTLCPRRKACHPECLIRIAHSGYPWLILSFNGPKSTETQIRAGQSLRIFGSCAPIVPRTPRLPMEDAGCGIEACADMVIAQLTDEASPCVRFDVQVVLDPLGREPSVIDRQYGARHNGRLVARQKHCGRGQFVWTAERPAQQRFPFPIGPHLGVVFVLIVYWGIDGSGSNRVGPNSLMSVVGGDGFHEHDDADLGRAIRRPSLKSNNTTDGCGADYRPAARLDDVWNRILRVEEGTGQRGSNREIPHRIVGIGYRGGFFQVSGIVKQNCDGAEALAYPLDHGPDSVCLGNITRPVRGVAAGRVDRFNGLLSR